MIRPTDDARRDLARRAEVTGTARRRRVRRRDTAGVAVGRNAATPPADALAAPGSRVTQHTQYATSDYAHGTPPFDGNSPLRPVCVWSKLRGHSPHTFVRTNPAPGVKKTTATEAVSRLSAHSRICGWFASGIEVRVFVRYRLQRAAHTTRTFAATVSLTARYGTVHTTALDVIDAVVEAFRINSELSGGHEQTRGSDNQLVLSEFYQRKLRTGWVDEDSPNNLPTALGNTFRQLSDLQENR